ncbi:MAG: PD-(D/E)XK nuclease family protein [Flavobacteriaceae bacterium]
MQTFISETIDEILLTQTSFEDCVFVMPSQRAGVFVKETFKNKIKTGFLPKILNIESFIGQISQVSKADSIQLLFHFYTIYCEIEEHPDSFEIFSSWAFVVIQDFNEIDQYLINSDDIFTYLRDIQRMKKWSVKGEFKETELIKDHLIFMERLGTYYKKFYSFLLGRKIGYQGLMYREATKKARLFLDTNKQKKFFFIGFNALNKSEELLFQLFLEYGNSEIYWDIDKTFFEKNHSAGNFIRKYKKDWKYFEKNELKNLSNHFLNKKNIEVIGATKNVSQLKYAGEILKKFSNHQNTALVLGDETLLSVALNSIPENVNAINITMGYPLQNVPTSQLISSIFHLFITQDKLQKIVSNEFYHKDIVRFFNNPIVFQLINEGSEGVVLNIQETISKENKSFVNETEISSYLEPLHSDVSSLLLSIFKPFSSVDDFITRILNLIESARDMVSVLEKEYLYRFYNAFTQLQNLNSSRNYFQNIKTLFQFYRRIIANEKLSFQGEPLNGLQLMGMLETRVLDFENVIITSVNENVIPSNNTQNSFIPFDIKVEFGLPTYRDKDAIYSYHFFRLLQRAKNIYLIYNTENDSFGSGEKSRFIAQLELMRTDIISKLIAPKVITEKKEPLEFAKNKLVLERLEELAKKGISPSTITNYLYNPIAFYKQKILRINELDLVEETIAANTMGTVVHDTLEALYKPYINQFLTIEHLDIMSKEYKGLVKKYFIKHFKNGDVTTGKNRLVFEVSNRFVKRFLSMEKKVLKDKHQVKILGTELELEAIISVPGINFPIKIIGIVDRIDEFDGVTRIIDYKTGMVSSGDLKALNFDEIRDFKYNKAIQVLLYAYLYSQNNTVGKNTFIEAGIISFKNLKSGVLKMNFSSNYKNPENKITEKKLEEFIMQIKVLLQEIYNPEISFLEPSLLPF